MFGHGGLAVGWNIRDHDSSFFAVSEVDVIVASRACGYHSDLWHVLQYAGAKVGIDKGTDDFRVLKPLRILRAQRLLKQNNLVLCPQAFKRTHLTVLDLEGHDFHW